MPTKEAPLMAYRWLTELADVAHSTGYPVVEIDGWKTRGRTSTFGRPVFMEEPSGVLLHHTAGPRIKPGGPNYPSLQIVRDGRHHPFGVGVMDLGPINLVDVGPTGLLALFVLLCVVGGTSGATAPVLPALGATVVDGGATWLRAA